MHAGGQGFESLILHHFYAQNSGGYAPEPKSGALNQYADVVELADTPDLGSGAAGVQVRVLSLQRLQRIDRLLNVQDFIF